MPERNLLEVTHYMCARIMAMCELMNQHRDWTYGGHVIYELSETLQRMPFTAEEGALIHRTLEPLVAKFDRREGWIQPLLSALDKIPGKPCAVGGHQM